MPLDMKEIDKRGRLRFEINVLLPRLSTEEMQDALDYIELRVEVKEANAQDVKSEIESYEVKG